MTLIGYRSENHPQQVRRRGPNPEVDDRATHPEDFRQLHQRFHFTIDVAAQPHNAKRPCFYSPVEDGLTQPWSGERVWCNPPFSSIEPWVRKAWTEWDHADGPSVIVMLLPANRTEQRWWQELVEPFRDKGHGFHVEFLPGRMRFIRAGSTDVGPNERPPFGCCLLIWGDS